MSLQSGSSIGPYLVIAPLGAGGMGLAYRATDTKLNRDVALKILPPSFVHDVDRVARFRREAQVLASVNHPNIGSIHGLEDANGIAALVLEYVEGPTLADRIARGALTLDEVLPVASQIADALDAAHEQGIVHRDLKPANIKVRPDGTVKVLDFGLAKPVDSAASAAGLTNSPTITSPVLSEAGMILGTASYMSPEQARGQVVDRRADIWAFGCVMFEMLTGTRAFPGDNVTDVIAGIVRGTPDWTALPSAAKPIAWILQRCLERDVKRRFHDVGDVKVLLEDSVSTKPSATATVLGTARMWWAGGGLLAGLLVGSALVALIGRAQPAEAPPRLARFELAASKALPLAADIDGTNVAIAPDASRLVYTTRRGGGSQLAVRVLDELEATPIAGTEAGLEPFFSPDGRSLGFATFRELKRAPMTGGPVVTICPVDAYFSGASWGGNDTIVFTQQSLGLLQVPASGGKPVTIATPDQGSGEQSFWTPLILPDGRSVLYTVRLKDGARRIVARRLTDTRATTVVEGGFGPRYLPSGYLAFGQADRLMVARFDPRTLKLSSEPVAVPGSNVLLKASFGVTNVAMSSGGTMAYVSGHESGASGRLVWADRNGRQTVAISQPLEMPRNPRFSPDAGRVAITVGPAGQGQIWVLDLGGKAQPLKLTFHDHSLFPIWSADGKRIAFMMRSSSSTRIVTIPADGSAVEPDTLVETMAATEMGLPIDWARDGASMIVERGRPSKIILLSLATRELRPWLQTPFEESAGRLSPDGSWLAYTTNQSGSSEVWVRPFPGPGAPVRVSSEGGAKPLWSRDGREILYENGPKMMASRLQVSASSVAVDAPRLLFEGGFVRDDVDPHMRYADVASDGRILMVESAPAASAPSLVLVQHWNEDLKRLIPSR